MGQLVLRDDVGTWVNIPKRVTRIISLVPSLTEAISQTHLGSLVGVTEWCSYPPDLDVTRVRGTKNPDCKTIVGLRPDLVLANKEENREIDVRRLRESGICVWVTDIKSIPQAFDSLDRIFEPVLRWGRPEWLLAARDAWSSPPPSLGARVAVPVWRDPWMVVGSSTFTGDLITRLGLEHVFHNHRDRYPKMGIHEINRRDIDLVLLPDEPYAFNANDGPEAFDKTLPLLVSGRLLTWYGPSLVKARLQLSNAIVNALGQ